MKCTFKASTYIEYTEYCTSQFVMHKKQKLTKNVHFTVVSVQSTASFRYNVDTMYITYLLVAQNIFITEQSLLDKELKRRFKFNFLLDDHVFQIISLSLSLIQHFTSARYVSSMLVDDSNVSCKLVLSNLLQIIILKLNKNQGQDAKREFHGCVYGTRENILTVRCILYFCSQSSFTRAARRGTCTLYHNVLHMTNALVLQSCECYIAVLANNQDSVNIISSNFIGLPLFVKVKWSMRASEF